MSESPIESDSATLSALGRDLDKSAAAAIARLICSLVITADRPLSLPVARFSPSDSAALYHT